MIILILLTLCVVGGGFAFVSMQNKKKKAAAATWLAAPGTITVSTLMHENDRDPDGTVSHVYLPQVRYTYAVAGAEHQGTRIAFANTRSANSKKAQSWCDRFPVGSAVTVYYDPAKPQDAVLDRGDKPG